MRLILLLLPLLTAVSAIDVYLQYTDCNSNAEVCTNWNPNTCCGRNTESFKAVRFRAIPSGWHLDIRGHWEGQCKSQMAGRNIYGPADQCMTAGAFLYFSGAGYGFLSKRGDIDAREPETCSAESKCTSFQQPDAVEFADGARYDLKALAEGEESEILAIAATGANSDAVPAKFLKHLKM